MSTLKAQDIKLGMYLRVPKNYNSVWYGIGKVVKPRARLINRGVSLKMITGLHRGSVGSFEPEFLHEVDAPFEMTITYGGTYLIDFDEYGDTDDSHGYPRVRQVHLG